MSAQEETVTINQQVLQEKKPLYFDTAIKNYVQDTMQAQSLKNRVKVMNINHQRLLKKIENHHQKFNKIQQTRQKLTLDNRNMQKLNSKKNQEIILLKENKDQRKKMHQDKMNELKALLEEKRIEKMQAMKKSKQQCDKIIRQSKQKEFCKKREKRDKVFEENKFSRVTVQKFFNSKQEYISQKTQDQIKQLNYKQRSVHAEQTSGREQIGKLQKQLGSLRQSVNLEPISENKLSKTTQQKPKIQKSLFLQKIEKLSSSPSKKQSKIL